MFMANEIYEWLISKLISCGSQMIKHKTRIVKTAGDDLTIAHKKSPMKKLMMVRASPNILKIPALYVDYR